MPNQNNYAKKPDSTTHEGVAAEAVSSGDYVYLDGSDVWKADASNDRPAVGYVKQSANINTPTTVYFDGINAADTGLSPGPAWLSDANPGQAVSAPPALTGHIKQFIGQALTSTSLAFEPDQPITLI